MVAGFFSLVAFFFFVLLLVEDWHLHPLTIVVVSRLAKIASKHFTSSDTFPSLVLPGDLFLETKEGRIQEKTLALISKRKKRRK